MRASVRVQRFICLVTLFLVLSVIASGLVNHEIVGVGRFETEKMQAVWFPAFFLYCSGRVWNLISITRRSSSFAALTGTSAATLLRPLSTALAVKRKSMEFLPLILKVGALVLLSLALIMARLNSKSVLETIAAAAGEIPRKSELITKCQWDFNILFASVLIVVVGILELIESQTFTVLLTAVLAGLGVKSVTDLKGNKEK